MKLQNKVALVTGAASGIGRAIVVSFAREGAKVFATDINAEWLATLADEVKASGGEVTTFTGSVAERADINRMMDEVVAAYGRLDIVVNNAGVMDEFVALAEMDDALWDKVMTVNLDGPMAICRRALQIMLPQGGGSIVNIASVGGLFGGRAGAAYTTSKHAVIGLSRNIAYHYAQKGIRCNVIAPGPVATNIQVKSPDPLGYSRLQTTLGMITRQGQPDELAAAALFLASDDASFVNGAVLTVDGGWTAG